MMKTVVVVGGAILCILITALGGGLIGWLGGHYLGDLWFLSVPFSAAFGWGCGSIYSRGILIPALKSDD